MTIVDHSPDNKAQCTSCGNETHAPFLEWRWNPFPYPEAKDYEPKNLVLCSRCASRCCRGLIRDLILMRAAHDIEHLTDTYGLVVTAEDIRSKRKEFQRQQQRDADLFNAQYCNDCCHSPCQCEDEAGS